MDDSQSEQMAGDEHATRHRRALQVTRIGVPLLIATAGLIVLLAGDSAAAHGVGLALIATAGLVVIANALMRLGLSSQDDRRREQHAREHVDRTGHWPT